MGYTVIGRLIDKDKNPIEFAQVYTSDSNGKPIAGSKSAETDLQGRWRLNDVNDSDYITGTMVMFNKKTIPAKSIVAIPNPITGVSQRAINLTLSDSVGSNIKEVVVKSTKVTVKPKNVGKYIMIGGVSLLLLTGIILLVKKKAFI